MAQERSSVRIPEDLSKFLSFDSHIVLREAAKKAAKLGHHYLGPGHFLIALTENEQTGHILSALGIDHDRAFSQVDHIDGHGESFTDISQIRLEPVSKKVIEFGILEAQKAGTKEVTPIQLLAGLVEQGENIGVGAIEALGVPPHKVLAAIAKSKVKPSL